MTYKYYNPISEAYGNQKSTNNKNIKFYNFSLPAVITCPHSHYCKKICFAYSTEKKYPITSKKNGAMLKRYKNLLYVMDGNINIMKEYIKKNMPSNDVEKIINIINQPLNMPKKTFVDSMIDCIKNLTENKKEKIYIRIHSDGDFYCKEYFEKWCKIVKYFDEPKYKNVQFMAYTKEIKMIKENFTISYLQSLNMKIVFSEINNKTMKTDIEDFNYLQNKVNNTNSKNYMIKYTVYNSNECNKIPNDEVICKTQCQKCSDHYKKQCRPNCSNKPLIQNNDFSCAECLQCYDAKKNQDIGVLNLNKRKIKF